MTAQPHTAPTTATTAARISRGASRPRRTLAGGISVTANRSVRPTATTLNAHPTAAAYAAIRAGETLTNKLLTDGFPTTLAAQAAAIARASGPIAAWFADKHMDRRGPMFAEAAARFLVTYRQPTSLVFTSTRELRTWQTDHLENHLENHLAENADGNWDDLVDVGPVEPNRLTWRPRIVWAHPDGIEHGVLVDRFHNATRATIVERDSWTRARVLSDLRAINTLLGPQRSNSNLGVRVMTHLAPNAGIHFLPGTLPTPDLPTASLHSGSDAAPRPATVVIGRHHPIGDCAACAPRTVLPDADHGPTSRCIPPHLRLTDTRPAGARR